MGRKDASKPAMPVDHYRKGGFHDQAEGGGVKMVFLKVKIRFFVTN
jgi:hypothetical protein